MKGNATRVRTQVQVVLVCLVCLGLGWLLGYPGAVTKPTSTSAPNLHSVGAPFVIADLDGDREPDLALVETGSARSANTSYSIRLQFSAGAKAAIGVIAPLGGLRVAARDVNGDDKLDLIVTSNLDAHFIEILLNDGHGNFSVAEQGAYSGLENESRVFLHGPANALVDQATLPSLRSSFSTEAKTCYNYRSGLSSDRFPQAKYQTASRRVAKSHLGRSPPVLVAFS